MPADLSPVNSIWAAILVESLQRLGLTTAVICPGSRSTPLAMAFAEHQQIEAIPVLDERSASFFALGLAKRSKLPVALVCTSGTAGANFYPALIEAKEGGVPLLVLTADRPPELRDCNAGQTIDQVKLFGTFPNWQTELALPSLKAEMPAYLRQVVIQAWEKSLWPIAGPVHLNIPFREPLVPSSKQVVATALEQLQTENFFIAIEPLMFPEPPCNLPPTSCLKQWQQCDRGLIIAGPAQPSNPEQYCRAIAHISQNLGWPVLAEGLSPLRNYASVNSYLISSYDIILRNQELAKHLVPDMILRIGEMPTSKELRLWLAQTQPQCWVVGPGNRDLDPLHLRALHLRLSVEKLAYELSEPKGLTSDYLNFWCSVEAKAGQAIKSMMRSISIPFEGKVAWLLSQILPSETPLFIANSMPVRDVEFFWQPGNSKTRPFFNRGANGIDGTLSTALGVAHRHQSAVLLTGDLALLHDTNGFLIGKNFSGHLTILLINNNGGGIFENLPVAAFDPPFEEFFATPQNIDFAKLCATYGVSHELIQSWEQLTQQLNPLPPSGIRVLELETDRKVDAAWRKANLVQLAESAGP